MKTIKPLKDNVIIRGAIKQGGIIIPGEKTDSLTIEKIEVFKFGEDVKNLKEGQRIIVNPRVFSETERVVDPFDEKGKVKTNEEFYLVIKESEIIGTF